MTTKIYSYGCDAPDKIEEVREQNFKAHQYRNKLCEIELKRRKDSDDVLRSTFPDLAELEKTVAAQESSIEAFCAEMSARNASDRSVVASGEDKAAIKKMRAELKIIRTDYRNLRKAAFANPLVKQKLKEASDASFQAIRDERAKCGVYWGTYLCVEDAAKKFGKGAPPRFKPFDREGRIAVQIQGGMSVSEMQSGSDTRLRMDCAGGRRKLSQRIGSNDDRSPIMASTKISYHRPLPDGVKIKWAWLKRERVGTHEKWKYQFVIDGDSAAFAKPCAGDGVVGVDIGWRLIPGGLRVAYWVGSDGAEGELVLPHKLLSRWPKSESLQSIRDREFNAIRERLNRGIAPIKLPDCLKIKLLHIGQWKSPKRLAIIINEWKKNRFEGDEELMSFLEPWRKQDKHLYDWQTFNLRRAALCRKDMFWCFIAMLRKRYALARIEDIDWSKMQERPLVEDQSNDDKRMREYRRIASPGMLAEMIKHEMSTEKMPAEQTTMRCHACHELSGQIDRGQLIHTCGNCGAKWDQDQNAAKNLLASVSASAKVA